MKIRDFLLSAITILSVFFAGCATTQSRENPINVNIAESVGFDPTPLCIALFDLKGVKTQAIAGNWKDNNFTASCVMKGENEKFTIVFSAPQMRLVTIELTKPHTLTWKKAPQIPNAFEPEYAICDVAFANLETSALKKALGKNFSVVDDGIKRVISVGQKEIAILERSQAGSMKFTNPLRGYSYTIQNL